MSCRSWCERIIVPPWSLWHHPCRDPTKTFFPNKLSLPPLLVGLQLVLWVCNHHNSVYSFCVEVCNFNVGLDLHDWFAIVLWVCNFIMVLQFWRHLFQHILRRHLVLPLSIRPWHLELNIGHGSPWKTKNKLLISKIDFCLQWKSSRWNLKMLCLLCSLRGCKIWSNIH